MPGELNCIAESDGSRELARRSGSASQVPETEQAGLGEPPMHPLWGSEVEHRDPTQKAVCGLSAQCDTYLAPRLGRGRVRRVLEPDPAATGERRVGRECGDCASCTAILAILGPGEKGNCSFF